MKLEEIVIQEYNKLGQGVFGKVFEKDGFAYKITRSKVEAVIAKMIMDNQGNFKRFPKIYSVTKGKSGLYWIIKRELLSPLKPTDAARINALMYEIGYYINNDRLQSYEKIKKSNPGEKILSFIDDLKKDYDFLNINKGLDIHGGNLGLNKNGDIILFDF